MPRFVVNLYFFVFPSRTKWLSKYDLPWPHPHGTPSSVTWSRTKQEKKELIHPKLLPSMYYTTHSFVSFSVFSFARRTSCYVVCRNALVPIQPLQTTLCLSASLSVCLRFSLMRGGRCLMLDSNSRKQRLFSVIIKRNLCCRGCCCMVQKEASENEAIDFLVAFIMQWW